MTTSQLAHETIAPGEAASIEAALAVFSNESNKNNQTGITRRGQHAKLHGLVKAEFVVPGDLAPDLRVGLFSHPKTYQAWVRFSNGDGKHRPDYARDTRGMAIKVLGVPGLKLLDAEREEQTHDFVLMSTPVFISQDAQNVVEVARAVFGSMFAKGWYLLTHWRSAWLMLKMLRRFANPLQIRYFSCTPYLFGTQAVKYAATPHVDVPDTIPRDRVDNYLRTALVTQLKAGEAQFDFCVQFQTDARAMPIEDPRREWSESASPFRKVATIRILQQDCDSPQQRAFAENLSFSPWHALPEHRPLGGINRARKVIYETMSAARQARNQAPRREPTDWDIPWPSDTRPTPHFAGSSAIVKAQASGVQTPPRTFACDQALQALAQRDAATAIAVLEPALAGEPSAQVHALLGAAHYQAEQYELAGQYYAHALTLEPGHADWLHMQALAHANATAAVHQHVPDLHYFEREALLAAPARFALPVPLPSPPAPGLLQRIRIGLGNELGAASSSLMHHATHLFAKMRGYRGAVWTNWYGRPVSMGILTLAYMRDQLNARNLKSSYPAGALTAFQPSGLTPPPGVTHFRTADGSWNNLADPKEGAAGTRFLRNIKPDAMHAEVGERLLTPNPRVISRTLFARPTDPKTGQPLMKEVPFLNMLAGAWIQFMNGDWINHGDIRFTEVIEVPLPEDDPARTRYWQTKMFIGRTQADPTRQPQGEDVPTSSINEVTHWWDGSQIYGSDQATQDGLRSGVDGKLRLTEDQRLPLDRKGVEQTGFTRNWWLGMSLLHTLFAREHNAICDELKANYPAWDDNRLFNVARLVNAAVMAKIHTVEWTPAILPNKALNIGINGNWYGVLTNLLRKPADRRTVADINVRDPVLGGVVGNPIEKHNVAYGLSEEFTEIYRLHSLLPETLKLQRQLGAGAGDELPFSATRQSGSAKITSRYAMADLLYSFGNQNPGALELHNYPRFMQELSIPGNPFFDMGTVDILRARERGVPRYNEFRRQLLLGEIRSFEDLTDDAEVVSQLKAVYGSHPEAVEDLDLLVGTLAEGHRPTHFGFGETMFQIFLLNATRRLQADRFFTDCYNAEFYTEPGLRWVDRADFKTVLLRHHPELAATGLANIRNAFEPWDIEAQLDPARHPLRACDATIKHDPWRGDAHRQEDRS